MNIDRIIVRKQGEAVLRIVRHYWLTFLPKAAFAFLLVAAPLFFMVPLFRLGSAGKAIFIASLVFGSVYALRVFVEWWWNAFVITTKRVIDIDQRGFFRRTVSEAPYDRIQDISFAIRGFWGTIFRFGSVSIQTAGTNVNLELPDVKDPKSLHHLITETRSIRQANDTGGAGRASQLLAAASELTDAEARAFLVTLQGATAPKDPEMTVRSLDGVEEFMNGGDDEE
jgi:uncharacterized membrane protein YdbT with pleckstrin-like domain